MGLRRVHRWKQEREAAHRTPALSCARRRENVAIDRRGRKDGAEPPKYVVFAPSHLLLRGKAEASEAVNPGTVWKHS